MSSQLYKGAPGPGLAGAGSRRTPSAYPPPLHSDCRPLRLALSTVAPFIFLRKTISILKSIFRSSKRWPRCVCLSPAARSPGLRADERRRCAPDTTPAGARQLLVAVAGSRACRRASMIAPLARHQQGVTCYTLIFAVITKSAQFASATVICSYLTFFSETWMNQSVCCRRCASC